MHLFLSKTQPSVAECSKTFFKFILSEYVFEMFIFKTFICHGYICGEKGEKTIDIDDVTVRGPIPYKKVPLTAM